jgi:glycosyltransferase involved in cell wall biosynthesis
VNPAPGPFMRGSQTAPAKIDSTRPANVEEAGVRPPRLLVVSYHFPPGSAVGALRWAGLTKYLARGGWDVRVVSASGPDRWKHEPAVTVIGRRPHRTLNDRYVEWKRRRSNERAEAAPRSAASRSGRRGPRQWFRLLLKELGGVLSWPDEGRGWIRPGAKATRDAIREFSPDVVVSSGPPHSAHLAVRLALGRSGIPWFMDLRDPWAQQEHFTRLERSTFRWLEAGTVRRASGLIVTTPQLREVLAADYPATPVHWVPNGVDLDLFPAPDRPPFPGLGVIHLGSVYSGRDPGPLLEAFGRFLRDCPDAGESGSAVRFVGTVESRHRGTIDRAAASGLGDRIELVPHVPRDEALSLLQRSALSVVLAQQQREMVPAKLYESVALGLPTLVIAEKGSASFEAAERVGALRAEPDDIEGIVEIFFSVWRGEVEQGRDPDALLDYGALSRVVDRLLQV